MTDHSLFIRIGDGAVLQFSHRGEGLLHRPFHFRKEIIWKIHPAHIQRQTERWVVVIILLEALPKLLLRESHKRREVSIRTRE